jgi:hypothetical protein
MSKTGFILGGCGLFVLTGLAGALEITRHDPLFWFLIVPLALIFGTVLGYRSGASGS